MDIELFRDFIDYLDNKKIIYAIDNLSIDTDNTINLNRKKFAFLDCSSLKEGEYRLLTIEEEKLLRSL